MVYDSVLFLIFKCLNAVLNISYNIFDNSMPFTDDQIRTAVVNLFKKYDKDNSDYIDSAQIPAMLNDLANELKTKKSFTNEQIQEVLGTVDKNQDGRLTKD